MLYPCEQPWISPLLEAPGFEMSLAEYEEAEAPGADVLQVGSFKELQAGLWEDPWRRKTHLGHSEGIRPNGS